MRSAIENQQLRQRVFDAAPPYIKTVWQVHQEDSSERDDNDARRAKSNQSAAQNRQPLATCASPTRYPTTTDMCMKAENL